MISGHFTLTYRLSNLAWSLVVLFIVTQSYAILETRGVADPEGFIVNTSKPIPVNTYEDDAQVSLMHALSYFGPTTNTFDVATNFGGPLLHLAKPVMWLGAKLGLIKRFDDRSLYILYPNELKRIFILFSFYKLSILTLLPLSVFWLLNNFFSRRAGHLALFFLLGMPFLSGFELRLKPDGVVFAITILSLMHQLAYSQSSNSKHLYLAAVFLALATSMKFTMATATFTYIACFIAGSYYNAPHLSISKSIQLICKATILGIIVFTLANPRIIPGLLIFVDFIFRYTAHNAQSSSLGDFFTTILFRLTNFQAFLGSPLGYFALPAFVFSLLQALRAKQFISPWSILGLLYIFQILFLWAIAHNHVVRNLTYYYYGQALLSLILIALLVDYILTLSSKQFVIHMIVLTSTICTIALLLNTQLSVLKFISGPSTRQLAQAWVDKHIPPGASLGLPVPKSGHMVFYDRFMPDPYRYRILPVGLDGKLTDNIKPSYILWVRTNPLQTVFSHPDYEQIALFDTGKHLPREAFNFFQDDMYFVYRRIEQLEQSCLSTGPADADTALGTALADERDQEFNLIQYKSSGIFPQDLTVLNYNNGRFLPFGRSLFLSAIRHPTSPVTYLHQTSPELLRLWGVKYIAAKRDEAFLSTFASWNREFAPMSPSTKPEFPEGIGLYQFTGYDGMAHFLPSPPIEMINTTKPRRYGLLERHRIKSYGPLYLQDTLPRDTRIIRVQMTIECTGSMDLLLKSRDHSTSLLLGPGHNVVDFPLPISDTETPAYELNPAEPSASGTIKQIITSPLLIEQATTWSLSVNEAFATVNANSNGFVAFALPFHPYWTAEVDGKFARPEPGPGNVVIVPVNSGQHLVSLRYADLQ